MASMTSPEHGAQQECSSTFERPSGNDREGRNESFIFEGITKGC